MEISYRIATIITNHRIMDELVHEYFRDTIAKENLPLLDIDWKVYIELERVGNTVVVGAWDEGKLVGFVMYVVMEHPHHKRVRYAHCDIIGVLPAYRGQRIGRLLIAASEHLLRDKGVHYVCHGERVEY